MIRRVRFLESLHLLSDEYGLLRKYPDPAMASADMGFVKLLYLKVFSSGNASQEERDLLKTSVKLGKEAHQISYSPSFQDLLDSSIPENWYLPSRACMRTEYYERAYESLQTAVKLEPFILDHAWHSILQDQSKQRLARRTKQSCRAECPYLGALV